MNHDLKENILQFRHHFLFGDQMQNYQHGPQYQLKISLHPGANGWMAQVAIQVHGLGSNKP